MSMIDIDKIVAVAALMHKVDQAGSDEDGIFERALSIFERALDQMSAAERPLVIFAGKLMQGKGYSVMSNNPENIRNYRSLAEHLGASSEETESDWPGLRQILFYPPARQ